MNLIEQLGIGGALALFVLREVFTYLKTRNGKAAVSVVPVCPLPQTFELWELRLSKAIAEAMTEALEPTLKRQNDLLETLAKYQQELHEVLIRRNLV